MKIIKQQAKSVSKLSTEELCKTIESPKSDVGIIESAIQDGYRRLSEKVFLSVISRQDLLNNKKIYGLVITFLEQSQPPTKVSIQDYYITIFRNLLYSNTTNLFIQKMTTISIGSPILSAIALLEESTPTEIINNIININRLNIPTQANSNHPILNSIMEFITKYNIQWSNTQSALILLTRILQNSSDNFILEASKQNLGFSVASSFLSASKTYSKDMVKNLRENNYPEVKLSFGLDEIATNGINTRNLDSVIELIKASPSTEYIKSIWGVIENSIKNMSALTGKTYEISGEDIESEPLLVDQIFTHTMNGESIVSIISEKDPSIIINIITLLKNSHVSEQILRTPSFSKMIHVGLFNPSIKDAVLSLPKEWFNFVMMTPENRNIISEHFYPMSKEEKKETENEDVDIDEIIGSKKTWYKKYSSSKTV